MEVGREVSVALLPLLPLLLFPEDGVAIRMRRCETTLLLLLLAAAKGGVLTGFGPQAKPFKGVYKGIAHWERVISKPFLASEAGMAALLEAAIIVGPVLLLPLKLPPPTMTAATMLGSRVMLGEIGLGLSEVGSPAEV